MEVSSETNQGDPKPPRRSGNLLRITGVGGGAIGGAFTGIAAIYDDFSMAVVFFVAIGAVIGALVPRVASLAFLGAIVPFVITATTNSQAPLIWMLCPLVGGIIGLMWTLVAWAWRGKHQGEALSIDREAAATARRDRKQLAWISLGAGLLLGLLVGIMIGGPFIIAGPFLGVVVGILMCIGLMLSTLGSRK